MLVINEYGIGGIVIDHGYNAEIGISFDVIRWDDGEVEKCESGLYPAFTSHFEAEAHYLGW